MSLRSAELIRCRLLDDIYSINIAAHGTVDRRPEKVLGVERYSHHTLRHTNKTLMDPNPDPI